MYDVIYMTKDEPTQSNCIFCSIVEKVTPSDIVFDGGDTLFFRDISPKAKVHVIGIPKKHLTSLDDVQGDDHALIGKLLHEAAEVASQLGILESGYRVLTNVGADAGQEVQHLHFHVIGGEPLGAMRC
jgi:histidine triad (HIT) family protein